MGEVWPKTCEGVGITCSIARSSSSGMCTKSIQRRPWLAISQPASFIAVTASGLRSRAWVTPKTVRGTEREANSSCSRQKPTREPATPHSRSGVGYTYDFGGCGTTISAIFQG